MKICYLYLSDFSMIESGVDHKVRGKCETLKTMFPGSAFVRFTTANETGDKDFFIPIKFSVPKKNRLKNFHYRRSVYKALSDFMKVNNGAFDFFIVRYEYTSLALLKILRSYPNKFIFEHNAHVLGELAVILRRDKKNIPFSLRPSVIAYYIESIWFKSLKEKKLAPYCLKYAAGGLAVTPEIALLEQEKYPGYKTLVVSNGLVPRSFLSVSPKPGLKVLNGVFLAGTNGEWHGIDRILESYLQSGVTDKINLYFVGKVDSGLKKKYNHLAGSGIFFIEFLKREELNLLLERMHFAIGSCAIYRCGVKEGAVLKVREYLSGGLPVVLGYRDPYIEDRPELDRYCIKFPGNSSIIDFNLIFDSVNQMYLVENLNKKIMQDANRLLSWDEVLKSLPYFLEELKLLYTAS